MSTKEETKYEVSGTIKASCFEIKDPNIKYVFDLLKDNKDIERIEVSTTGAMLAFDRNNDYMVEKSAGLPRLSYIQFLQELCPTVAKATEGTNPQLLPQSVVYKIPDIDNGGYVLQLSASQPNMLIKYVPGMDGGYVHELTVTSVYLPMDTQPTPEEVLEEKATKLAKDIYNITSRRQQEKLVVGNTVHTVYVQRWSELSEDMTKDLVNQAKQLLEFYDIQEKEDSCA